MYVDRYQIRAIFDCFELVERSLYTSTRFVCNDRLNMTLAVNDINKIIQLISLYPMKIMNMLLL